MLYVSVHGDTTNFYPANTDFDDERGDGPGRGFNLNLPMRHGSDEAAFFAWIDNGLQAVRNFTPTALVHALAFDRYKDDPQLVVSVSSEGFGELGRRVRARPWPA